MTTYEKSIKLSDNVIALDLIEIGGALFEVLERNEMENTIDFKLRSIANLAEQRRASKTLHGHVILPKGLMIEILK